MKLPGGLGKGNLKKMMDGMEEIPANKVIIKKKSGNDIIVKNPKVTKMDMMGKESYQVIGGEEEKRASKGKEEEGSKQSFGEEDIKMVKMQTDAPKEEIKEKLKENKGDITQTIMDLKED